MKKVLVLGLGKVGSLVGILLQKKFSVTGVDKQNPHYHLDLPFEVQKGERRTIQTKRRKCVKNRVSHGGR